MLAALVMGVQLAVPSQAASEFLTNMRKGENVKEYPDKVEFFDRAVKAWLPRDGSALLAECVFRRGEANFHLWRFGAAEPDLSKAISLDAGNVQARLLRSQAYLRLGKAAAAAKDAAEAASLAPEDPEGFLWLGEAHLKQDQAQAALRDFARAARLEGAGYRAALGQGRALNALREWDRARRALNDADRLSGGRSAKALTELAVCAVGQGRHEDALEAYGSALLRLEDRLQFLNRADAPAGERDDERAFAGKTYFGRGRVYEFLTRSEEALADYQRACELGHDEGCRRAEALVKQDVKPKPAARPPEPKPAPVNKEKKKYAPNPEDDPGERIYAN